MKLHDMIQHAPTIMEFHAPEERNTVQGEVVYIHPRHRYVTLEYRWRGGRTFRESFQLIPKEGV